MLIYCMSDIHGCLKEFEEALALVANRLADADTRLVLLGDYIHMGPDSRGVLDRVIGLQEEYGKDKVIALLGNHEESCISGLTNIDDGNGAIPGDEEYIKWMRTLPLYWTAGRTIFVHAGIDEEAADLWKVGTADYIFTSKYPAETGEIEDLDMKVVAGHIGTASISGNKDFRGIYHDGASHYYIDGSVYDSGTINVLLVDTDKDKYYSVTADGESEIVPYK